MWLAGTWVSRSTNSRQPSETPRSKLSLIENTGKYNYTWVKDLNHLLPPETISSRNKHFCDQCLHGYTGEDLVKALKPYYYVRIYFNQSGDAQRGLEKASLLEPPQAAINQFIVYADIETFIAKVDYPECRAQQRQNLQLPKSVFPYEYINTWKTFAEPQIPPKEAFYSTRERLCRGTDYFGYLRMQKPGTLP